MPTNCLNTIWGPWTWQPWTGGWRGPAYSATWGPAARPCAPAGTSPSAGSCWKMTRWPINCVWFFNFSFNPLPLLTPSNIHLLFFNYPLCLLQGLTKQYPVTPVVDSELLQMSMRLFRRTMAAQASGPERPDAAVVPAAEAAATAAPGAAGGSSKLSTAQPEVCVSWKLNGSPRCEKQELV